MMFLLIVTVSSMLLAAIMSVIAWRIAAQERRRSTARIAALSAEIHAPAAPVLAASAAQRHATRRAEVAVRAEPPRLAAVPTSSRQAARWNDLPLRAGETAPAAADLFTSTQRPTSTRRFAVAFIGIAAAVGLVLAGVGRRSSTSTAAPARAVAADPAAGDNRAAAPVAPPSLELVALGHVRDGERLIVRGVIRHAATTPAPEQLTAVVFAFNADGGFVTSARAALDAGVLRSAGEAAFVVTVPDAASASRYRVSFRSGDRIVPHVDRREPIRRP